MRIEIPKNTWISDVIVDFVKEGYFNGVLMTQVTFSGGACPGDEFIAELLGKLAKAPLNPKRKIVRLKGLYDPKDESILLLIVALKSWGFTVQAIIPNGFSSPWVLNVDWVILRLEKPTALIAANETWYVPPEGSPLVEPVIPAKSTYLYVTKGRGVNETIKFVSESAYLWSLL